MTTVSKANGSNRFGKVKEVAQLLWLNFRVSLRNLAEFVKVAYRYYRNTAFARTDLTLLSKYLLKNPYRISREHLQQQGAEEIYTYGETPLTTLELIARECGISESDTLFELGSGRGRGCFWLHHFVGCQVVGIEWLPLFVEKAKATALARGIEGVDFREEDLVTADVSGATVVYLYGTCMSDQEITTLAENLRTLPVGTKIITVSYPITNYGPGFEVLRRFPASFTWGEADVYLQIYRS